MNKDTLVGVFGAVILVAAMVGVFYYEGSQTGTTGTGGGNFNVAWQTGRAAGPTGEGTATVGDAANATAKVVQTNVTRAEFTFTWTAANCNPDLSAQFPPTPGTVRLTIQAPSGGPARSDTQDGGQITLTIDNLTAVPTLARASGATAGEATSSLANQYTNRAGTGDWRLTIELQQGGESRDPAGLAPQALSTCTGANYEFTSSVTSYSATVSP